MNNIIINEIMPHSFIIKLSVGVECCADPFIRPLGAAMHLTNEWSYLRPSFRP